MEYMLFLVQVQIKKQHQPNKKPKTKFKIRTYLSIDQPRWEKAEILFHCQQEWLLNAFYYLMCT